MEWAPMTHTAAVEARHKTPLESLPETPHHALATQFSALAHPARIEILHHLSRHENCGCKDVVASLPLAQSTVSQHLKILVEAGLVTCRVEHPHSRYNLDKQAFSAVSRALAQFVDRCCSASCCA
jgi:DNA-binding transcriptional ArsR family regulator